MKRRGHRMEVSEHILPLASQGKKLILFGAGDYGHRLAEILREQDEDFAYYIDNCSRGGTFAESPFMRPSNFPKRTNIRSLFSLPQIKLHGIWHNN